MKPIYYLEENKPSVLYHAFTSQGVYHFRLKKIKEKKFQFCIEDARMRIFYNLSYQHLEVIYGLLTDFFSQYPTNPELETEEYQDE